jgi:hypothetical protein
VKLSFNVDFKPTNEEEHALRYQRARIRLALAEAGIFNLTIHMKRGAAKDFAFDFEGEEAAVAAAKRILSES